MTQRGLRGEGIYRPTHKESKEMENQKPILTKERTV